MRHGLLVVLFITVAFAQKTKPITWHPATQAECSAEAERERKIINSIGLYGDPPITNGFLTNRWFDPCGYSDGQGHFRGRCKLYVKGKWKEVPVEDCL